MGNQLSPGCKSWPSLTFHFALFSLERNRLSVKRKPYYFAEKDILAHRSFWNKRQRAHGTPADRNGKGHFDWTLGLSHDVM